MRILQQHLDFIEYEPISKEISSAEDIPEKGKRRYEEIVVLFVSVEPGDDEETATKAMAEARSFLGKLKVSRVIIYPYAHLSSNLARPKEALEELKVMERLSKEAGLETYRAPFGWNKAFQIKVKGHPLAEQSRVYSKQGPQQVTQPPPAAERKPPKEPTEEQLLARIRKSDFGSLPETDHRIIGERLDLFSFQEPSPGMVYWHDKGVTLRNLLIEFVRSEQKKRGYIEVSNPSLANVILWKVSGHWDHYKDGMFFTQLGNEQFGLKPMNCPSTFLFYKTRKWSYREFPLRVADFDTLYRNELSGVASGLFRLKSFIQDDAHIFVTEDQIVPELEGVVDLMARFYDIFGLKYVAKISTMPDDHLGTKEKWDEAIEALKRAVKAKGLTPVIKEKDGAFYGPKIDVEVKDSVGREWQCATIQLDFQMPVRFKLAYTGPDGQEHTPAVIHRVIYGSLERFIGIITEHFQGKFPVWIAPAQVRVMTVSDESKDYAAAVAKELRESGLRVEEDLSSGTIGGKIRDAQIQKLPYMLVIGGKEQESKTVAVRARDGAVRYGVKLDDIVSELREKVANRS